MNRPEIRKEVERILKNHVGKANAISAAELYDRATGDFVVPSLQHNQTRLIRSIIQEIRREKALAVISGNGYWLAETDEELTAFTLTLLRAAERRFGLARTLSNVPVSRMVTQHKLNFTDEESNNV